MPIICRSRPCGPCIAAKNVILAGVKAVVLHDSSAVELRDLGAQFYLAEGDVGSNRAAACEAKLQELNSAVAVSSSQEQLSESFIAPFDVPLPLPLLPLRCRSVLSQYIFDSALLRSEPVPWTARCSASQSLDLFRPPQYSVSYLMNLSRSRCCRGKPQAVHQEADTGGAA